MTPTSPWAFLRRDRLGAPIARDNRPAHDLPLDDGVIFAGTGGRPLPQRAPARQRYRLMELKRWSRGLGVPIHLEPRQLAMTDAAAAPSTLDVREAAVIAAGVR
ncbi:MAG: hypothetical protein ACLFU0_07690 [Alphaproteobacteria bacterium]